MRQTQSEARRTLNELARLRSDGEQRLKEVWFPLYAFGAIYVGMAPAALLVHRDHLAPYFLVCLIIASILTARHYCSRGRKGGVETSVLPWLITSILMTVGGGVASLTGFIIGSEFLDTAGPFLVVAAFFLVFSAVIQSRILLVDAVGIAFLSTTSAFLARGNLRIAIEAVLVGTLLIASASFQLLKARYHA
jgi:hypothetical protein